MYMLIKKDIIPYMGLHVILYSNAMSLLTVSRFKKGYTVHVHVQ